MLGKRKYSGAERQVKRRKYNKTRPGYKATRSQIPSASVGSLPDGLPSRLFTVLAYNDRITLTQGTAGLPAVHVFRLNSLFDPDLTGVGHQPRYHDALLGATGSTSIYHRYRVHACEWDIRVVNADANVEHTFVVVPTPSGGLFSSSSDIDAICEAPYAVRQILAANDSGSNARTFKGGIMIKKLEGLNDLSSRDSLSSEAGSNPGTTCYLNLVACSVSEAQAIGQVHVDITLRYKCELWERNFQTTTN